VRIDFFKYQGTGNDFIMLDNLNGQYDAINVKAIQFLCDRKFGVGADGLIKLSSHSEFDFEVEYYNSDGSQSFCGNGARCSIAFANRLGLIDVETNFVAIDGAHRGKIVNDTVFLEMSDVSVLNRDGDDYVLDTGSPHYVHFKNPNEEVDIVKFGKEVRYSAKYKTEGINVNFIEEVNPNEVFVETYERGVEDETLSCGTGVTACALVLMHDKNIENVIVKTKGGTLGVSAEKDGQGFTNIWLSGPAELVFNGSVDI